MNNLRRCAFVTKIFVLVLGGWLSPTPGLSNVRHTHVNAPKYKHRAPTGRGLSLRALSLQDRIAQMIMVRGYGDFPDSNNQEYEKFLHWIRDDHVGGFIVAGRIRNGNVIPAQPHEMVDFINYMQRQTRVPLLVGSDFERGASARVAVPAKFPALMAFGAAGDMGAVKALGAATAREARALGVQWVFAPDADVNNNPDNPIINTRSFGENAEAVASAVAAFIEGAHQDPSQYVLVTAKHFPGHGDTSEDSHIQMARFTQTRERMEQLELVPFRAAIRNGVDAVMTAHMAVPAVDKEEIPSTLSPNVLTGLLRNELGFSGLVVTDAMEMQGITARYGNGDAAVRAVEAGADVLLMPPDPGACINAINQAVASGRISRERIDASVKKILAAKHRSGLDRGSQIDVDELSDKLAAVGGDSVAQHVAERAVTLVKDDRHLFPISDPAGACLVVMGESQFTTRGEALVTELERTMHELRVYVTTPYVADKVLFAMADDMSTCRGIYVATFVSVSANRGSVALKGALPQMMNKLLSLPVPVAMITFGNPYLLREFPQVAAYAATFSTTATSEVAAARAMTGQITISGRMPVSIPGLVRVGDGVDVPVHARVASNE